MSKEEILDKLYNMSELTYDHPQHSMSDWSTRHDDMIDELNWYEHQFEAMCELVKKLKEMK